MKCAITESGSHFYWFLNGKIRITLLPYDGNKLEMSITLWRFYRVYHFGEK